MQSSSILNIIFANCGVVVLTVLIIVAVLIPASSKSRISTGALVGIILGSIACAVTLSAIVTLLILRMKLKDHPVVSKRRRRKFLIMSQQVYCYFAPSLVSSVLWSLDPLFLLVLYLRCWNVQNYVVLILWIY